EGRAGAALPARSFEREEVPGPFGKASLVALAGEGQRALVGESSALPAQFLALLAGQRGLEIGLGREVGGEQSPLLAVDEADGATLPGADPHQRDGERPGKRLVGQVEEQSWACRAVGMGEEGSPEGSFRAP